MTVDNADQENQNKTDDQSASIDTDWGKDWEAAFQSEDAMLPREDAGSHVEEFFLDDAHKPPPSGQEPGQQTDTDKTIGSADLTASGTGVVTVAAPGSKISSLWAGLLNRLSSFSLKQKIIAALLAVGISVIISLGLHFFPTPLKQPVAKLDMPALPPIPDVVVGPTEEPGSLPKVEQPNDQHGGETPHTAEPLPQAQSEQRNVRQKWAFPDFTIPTTIKSPDKGLSFVRLKITLIASLPPDQSLPQEKKIIVREIIYQFFQKQSPDELQRFVRTRGDLSRGLLSWLAEQWPDNPVKAVQIDSYSLT